MSPRTGRPKVDKPKTIEAKVRLNEDENKELLLYCKENYVNKSEALRRALALLLDK